MKKKVLIAALFFLGGYTFVQAQPQQLRLEDCVNIALENNLNIKRGELDVQNQEITVKQSKYNQLPNLNLGGNNGSNWGRSIDPTSNTFITQRIGFSGLNGSSNWVLFSGLQTRNTIAQSSIDLRARNFDLEKTKNDITLRVIDAYLNVIFSVEQQENSKFQLESTQQQLELTKKLVDAGALPIINSLNLESQLASDELLVIQNENNYNLALLTLKQLMLLPANTPIELEREQLNETNITAITVSPDAIYEMAKDFLPEVKSANLGIESADAGYKVATGRRYPTLSMNGGFSTNYSTFADRDRLVFDGTQSIQREIGFLTATPSQTVSTVATVPKQVDVLSGYGRGDQFSDNLSRSVSISIQIPVFNRYQTSAAIQRSKITQVRAEITLNEVTNQVRQNIESAYNDALAASKSFDATRKQVQALEESFRVIQSQYNIGAVNFTDFQIANNNLVRAKSDLIRAKYQYIFRIKVLDFYQGKPITL
jgi:outer membrane protein